MKYTVTITDIDTRDEGDGEGKGNSRGANRCFTCHCLRGMLSGARQLRTNPKMDGKIQAIKTIGTQVLDLMRETVRWWVRNGSSERM